jgi:hypothetical protein
MIRIAAEFGFTPASRSRLATAFKSDPWLDIPRLESKSCETRRWVRSTAANTNLFSWYLRSNGCRAQLAAPARLLAHANITFLHYKQMQTSNAIKLAERDGRRGIF